MPPRDFTIPSPPTADVLARKNNNKGICHVAQGTLSHRIVRKCDSKGLWLLVWRIVEEIASTNYDNRENSTPNRVTMDPGTITRLLAQADRQDAAAAAELYRLVGNDLQMIARKRKRVVGVTPSLDASTTGLVDDAFCRLVGTDATRWQPGDRRKFFSYMSRKIHGDLIDLLRREGAEKRGGGQARVEVSDALSGSESPDRVQLLLDMQAALDKLDGFNPDGAALVRYRHFLGTTFEEAADLLGVSKTEAQRIHDRAMRWLEQELQGYAHDA